MESRSERRKRKLQLLCDATPGGIKAVADAAQLNYQSLQQILAGTLLPPKLDGSRTPKSLGDKAAATLEDELGLGKGWFDNDGPLPAHLGGEEMEEHSSIEGAFAGKKNNTDLVIREYDTGGSMGRGLMLADQPGVIKEWRVSERWAQENVHRVTSLKNLAIVTGFGPSMQPLFNPGDPLLVDRGITRADVDGIYFFRIADEGFVKQLQRIPTEDGLIFRAKSFNPSYDPFDITRKMDFEVFARVVKVWKSEDF
ncbi:S24 family peptidase [Delftia acidovorans]|uniref:S24 family peptidase n=1 Tax=Delftia acidovorans TaxID=80866 RepID=UPI002FDCC0AE